MSLIPLTNEYPDALLLETTYENDDDVVIPPATTGYEEEGSVTVGALLMQTTTTTTTTTITTTPAAAAGGGTTRTRTQRRGIYRQVVMNEPLVDALSAVIEYQQAATGDAGPISSYPAVQENPPARRPAFTQDIGDDEMNDVVRLSISETSAINRHF